MFRARIRTIGSLLLPLLLLPGGVRVFLCLAFLGIEAPCATCADDPAVTRAAHSCCGECSAPTEDRAEQPQVDSVSSRAADCDCCVACETTKTPSTQHVPTPGVIAPPADYPEHRSSPSRIVAAPRHLAAPPRERGPPGATVPLRI